jgi:hypothetical protein
VTAAPTETLNWLKAYLIDNPYPAFLAISLFTNAVQFGLYVRMMSARVEDWKALAPLAQEYLALTRHLVSRKSKATPKPPESAP